MANDEKESKPPKSEPMPATGCVVCGHSGIGVLGGALPAAKVDKDGNAGPRWHAECENDRPDVIRKVKARA